LSIGRDDVTGYLYDRFMSLYVAIADHLVGYVGGRRLPQAPMVA